MQPLSTLSTITAIPSGKAARLATPAAFAPLLATLGVSEDGVDGETRQVAAAPGKRLPVDPAGMPAEALGFVPAPIPLAAPPPPVSGSVTPTVGDAPRSVVTDVRAELAPPAGPSAPVREEASPTGDRTALATPEPGIGSRPDDRPARDQPDPLPTGANAGPRVNDVGARPEGIVERGAHIGAPLETRAAVVAADRAAPPRRTASTGTPSLAEPALAMSSTVDTAAMPVPVSSGPTVAPPPSRHREPMPDDALRALIASLPLIDAPRPPVGGVSGAPRSGQTQTVARRGTDLPFEAPLAGNATIQLPIAQAPVATPPVATPATEVSFVASAVAPSPNDPALRPPMAGETIAPRVVVAPARSVESMIAGASAVGALPSGASTTDASVAGPTDAGTTAPVPPPPKPPRSPPPP